MADILIKGLALPKKGDSLMIYVFPSGNVDYKGFHEAETHRTTAIELPPHELISVQKVCDYLAERADTSKEMGDEGTASLFTSMIGDILAIGMGVYNGSDN